MEKSSLTPLLSLVLFIAVALATGACSIVDPHNMIGRQMGEAVPLPTEPVPSTGPVTLDAAGRERAFDFVWRTINERYYMASLNGVDWSAVGSRYKPLALNAKDDDTFWDMLDRMTGELHDAHTRVESPKRVELRNRDEAISFGFTFLPMEGKLAIRSVASESDAWWAGVRPGMSLAAINGEPARAAFERFHEQVRQDSTERARQMRAARRLLSGEAGTVASFTFERADGTTFDATLTRKRLASRPMQAHRRLPSGYGYLRFTEWTVGVTARVLDALDELRTAPGIIIDLRSNPGGSAHAVNLVLERFFPRPTEMGSVITRSGKPVSLLMGAIEVIKLKRHVEGNANAYLGPVVILQNAASGSASELFAGTMQAAGRAAIVGEPSCGCLLGFLGYARVPGGAELAYSEVGFVLANNKRIEGEGVLPDHPVPLRIADLQTNRDRALEEAQALIATMKPWPR